MATSPVKSPNSKISFYSHSARRLAFSHVNPHVEPTSARRHTWCRAARRSRCRPVHLVEWMGLSRAPRRRTRCSNSGMAALVMHEPVLDRGRHRRPPKTPSSSPQDAIVVPDHAFVVPPRRHRRPPQDAIVVPDHALVVPDHALVVPPRRARRPGPRARRPPATRSSSPTTRSSSRTTRSSSPHDALVVPPPPASHRPDLVEQPGPHGARAEVVES